MNLLELKNVNKVYYQGESEVVALKGINLVVEKGDFITIFGPAGSGKTTLLNIISCLDKPSSGKFLFDGKELSGFGEKDLDLFREDKIDYIFSDFDLIPYMTVYENIEYAARLVEKNNRELRNKVMQILQYVELYDLKNKRPNELSSGQKKRVAIAVVMVKEPVLVLLDEPTINLDSKTADQIMEIIVKMNEDLGTTIIFSTRDLQMIDYAYKIIGIKNGKIADDEKESWIYYYGLPTWFFSL
ncbi:MAG: ABC transporter ATP-binding protein [Firmicutes bacterium]|nr:ABC transporter ATP-binding protein [Bacillota bacterium]